MLGGHLVIVRQLLAWGNVALGVDDDVLVPLDGDYFGVAVGFTGVIDEACQTPLQMHLRSGIRRASCSVLQGGRLSKTAGSAAGPQKPSALSQPAQVQLMFCKLHVQQQPASCLVACNSLCLQWYPQRWAGKQPACRPCQMQAMPQDACTPQEQAGQHRPHRLGVCTDRSMSTLDMQTTPQRWQAPHFVTSIGHTNR